MPPKWAAALAARRNRSPITAADRAVETAQWSERLLEFLRERTLFSEYITSLVHIHAQLFQHGDAIDRASGQHEDADRPRAQLTPLLYAEAHLPGNTVLRKSAKVIRESMYWHAFARGNARAKDLHRAAEADCSTAPSAVEGPALFVARLRYLAHMLTLVARAGIALPVLELDDEHVWLNDDEDDFDAAAPHVDAVTGHMHLTDVAMAVFLHRLQPGRLISALGGETSLLADVSAASTTVEAVHEFRLGKRLHASYTALDRVPQPPTETPQYTGRRAFAALSSVASPLANAPKRPLSARASSFTPVLKTSAFSAVTPHCSPATREQAALATFTTCGTSDACATAATVGLTALRMAARAVSDAHGVRLPTALITMRGWKEDTVAAARVSSDVLEQYLCALRSVYADSKNRMRDFVADCFSLEGPVTGSRVRHLLDHAQLTTRVVDVQGFDNWTGHRGLAYQVGASSLARAHVTPPLPRVIVAAVAQVSEAIFRTILFAAGVIDVSNAVIDLV
jgi:hypothetical protein